MSCQMLQKVIGGGADFVMLGGMLAGHDEGKGKIVKAKWEHEYMLNSMDQVSEVANKKHYGGLADYSNDL